MIEPDTPVEVSARACTHLQDAVRIEAFRPLRFLWLVKLLHSVQNGTSVPFCLDLMRVILGTFPAKPNEFDRDTILNAISKLINSPHNLLEVFFSDFKAFQIQALEAKSKILSTTGKDQAPIDLNETVLSGRLPLIPEIQSRLKFFHYILVNYDSILDARYYGCLWEILVDQPVSPNSSDLCFQWLLEGRKEDQTYVSVDDKNAYDIFVNRFLHLETFTPLAFRAFERYFLDANAKAHQIMWKNKHEDFVVLSLNLMGYPNLWRILLKLETCEEVATAAMNFLVKLTLKVSATLVHEYGIPRVREELLKQCFEKLNLLSQSYATDPTQETETSIIRILNLMIHFCHKCAQMFEFKIKSHGSITRGKPLTLIISNGIHPESEQNWTLECHSNEKLKQAKLKVKKLLGKSFEGTLAELFFSTKDEQQLSEENSTLEELKINNNQNLFIKSNQAVEKGQETVNRSRHTKTWTPKRERPPANAPETAKTIMEITNVTEPIAMLALKKNDWDLSSAISYLMEQDNRNSLAQEAENLDNDESEEGSQGEAIGILNAQTAILPSFMISFNAIYFDMLFQLLKTPSANVAAKLWELLMIIPTANDISKKIAKFNQDHCSVDWKQIFDISSHYTLLYSLQIVDSIVFPIDENIGIEERAIWANHLLVKDGVQYLLDTMLSRQWFSKTKDDRWAEPSAQERTCLALISKVLLSPVCYYLSCFKTMSTFSFVAISIPFFFQF